MSFVRYNKYEVIKLDDIEKYLSPTQRIDLEGILRFIRISRVAEGKVACNSYVVAVAEMSASVTGPGSSGSAARAWERLIKPSWSSGGGLTKKGHSRFYSEACLFTGEEGPLLL